MKVASQAQLERAREKLRLVERTFEEAQPDSSGSAHSHELTLRSLKRLNNQHRLCARRAAAGDGPKLCHLAPKSAICW
jgi:hypothetical protein